MVKIQLNSENAYLYVVFSKPVMVGKRIDAAIDKATIIIQSILKEVTESLNALSKQVENNLFILENSMTEEKDKLSVKEFKELVSKTAKDKDFNGHNKIVAAYEDLKLKHSFYSDCLKYGTYETVKYYNNMSQKIFKLPVSKKFKSKVSVVGLKHKITEKVKGKDVPVKYVYEIALDKRKEQRILDSIF